MFRAIRVVLVLGFGQIFFETPAFAADLILYNGKVLTADARFSVAEAIAIREGKILAVGPTVEILRHAGAQTRRLDLRGKTVIPGLVDTHTHLFEYALENWRDELEAVEPRMRQFRQIRIEADSVQDALTKIGERAKQAQPGHWLHLWIQPDSVAQDFRAQVKVSELDQLTPANPLVLRMVGIQRYVNGQFLEALQKHYGRLPEFPPLERDAAGKPTGRTGLLLVRKTAPDLLATPKTLAPVFKKEMEHWASYGITTWSSSISALNLLNTYVQLDRKGEMPMRFAFSHAMGTNAFPDAAGFYERLGDVAGHGTSHLWNIGVSTDNIDSAYPGLCTTIEARPEIKTRARCFGAPGQFARKVLHAAVKAGLRLSGVHAEGDGAVDHFMDLVEEASREARMDLDEIRAKRHAIDHCALNPRPDQIGRAKRLGIIWSCGPRFFVEFGARMAKDYGEHYVHEWSVPVKSILDAGGKVVMETDDSAMSRRGAFWYIEKLVTRKDEKGNVWGKEQAVDRKTALLMFTRWAAEYVLREDVLGSLELGKWADFVVIDRDFLGVPDEEINQIKVLLTVVGGKLVYTEPVFAHAEGLPQIGYRPK